MARGKCVVALAAVVLVFAAAGSATANIVGHWRLEEGPDGGPIGTTANSYGVAPDGEGKNGAVFDDVVPTNVAGNPGSLIYDPLLDTLTVNRFSLQADNDAANEYVAVPNPGHQDSFTLGMFIRIDEEHVVNGGNQNANIGARFAGGGDNRGWLWRYRVDNNDVHVAFYAEGDGNAGSVLQLSGGANVLSDLLWHHVALAHDETIAVGQPDTFLYVDYAIVASGEFPASKTFFNKDVSLLFGMTNTRSTALHVDEARYYSTSVGPEMFLRTAVPEPATLAILGGGLALAALRRRRRRA